MKTMSIFSETYQKIVGDRKVRVYEMAEFLDIAPQTLYQILGGRRKPADEEFTRKLSAYLGLSVMQTEKLLEASERTRLGEEL